MSTPISIDRAHLGGHGIQLSPFDSEYTTQYYITQVFPLTGNTFIAVHIVNSFDISQYLLMASMQF